MKATFVKVYLLGCLLLLTFFERECQALTISPGVSWSNQLDLETESGIKFKWTSTKPDQDGQRWLRMEVSAKATGYVGVGFSPNGGMIDGDMVIAWMGQDGRPNLKDFYGIENGPPLEDTSQDYTLHYFETNHDWTTVGFERRWDTCDNQDFAITNDTMRLIWAYSNIKPEIVNGNFNARYHGTNRGVKSVVITEGAATPVFPDEVPERFPGVKSFDMKMDNVPITLKDTYYFCKLIDPIRSAYRSQQETSHDRVHHMVLWECSVKQEEVPLFDDHFENNYGGVCFTPNMPMEWGQNCVAFSLVWVVGSAGQMLPQHVGSPLGEMHGGATYFMLEMHYENAAHRQTTDSSGIRLFYTDRLRKYDGGTILMGYRHSPFLLIPPNQNDFIVNGVCGKECTSKALPPGGVNITNAIVHLHLTGKRIRLRHYRNGIELPIIVEDNYYDFNYQVPRALKTEINILPGDEFAAECEYTTKDVNRYVIGGLATNQEMCQIFLFYYPRVPLTQCTSQYEFYDFFKGLNIDKVEGEKVLKALHMPYEPHLQPPEDRDKDLGDDAKELEAIEAGISFKSVFNHMNVTLPLRLRGKSVGQYLEEFHWTDEKGKTLESFWKAGKNYQFCSKPGLKRVILDEHIIGYPKVDKFIERRSNPVCLKKVSMSSGSTVAATAGLIFSFFIFHSI